VTFSVALLQIFPTEMSPKLNLEKGIEACHKAKTRGADLALFPEIWNIGYAALMCLEKHFPKPRNTVAIINSMGKVILTYSKVFSATSVKKYCRRSSIN
jgi:predicted amidohydrolase